MPETIESHFLTEHFSAVASRYNQLRTTDSEAVDFVACSLPSRGSITAADIGCGTGRYTVELGQRLGKRLFAYFVDNCQGMLQHLRLDPRLSEFKGFEVVEARAEELPLPTASLDCVLTFNAVHHFDVGEFLREVGRILRPTGLMFLYTRFRDQNERSIWGRYFPGFSQKETRLFDEEYLTESLGGTGALAVREVTRFSFQRAATRACLKERIENRHYSTFCLYQPQELETAAREFETTLVKKFGSREPIEWQDENAMIVAERVSLENGAAAGFCHA